MKALVTFALLALLTVPGEAATAYWNTTTPYIVSTGGLTDGDRHWMGILECKLEDNSSLYAADFTVEISEDYSTVIVAGDINGSSPAGTMVRYSFSGTDEASGLPFVGYFDMAWGTKPVQLTVGDSFLSLGYDAVLPEPTPEPTSGLLLLVGSAFLLIRRRS